MSCALLERQTRQCAIGNTRVPNTTHAYTKLLFRCRSSYVTDCTSSSIFFL